MMRDLPVVLLHTDQPEVSREILSVEHPEIVVHSCNSYQELPSMLQETTPAVVYSVRFDGTPKFPRQALIDCKSMQWLSVGGSGIDHIIPWNPEKLTVTNAAGVAADMMAQYVIGAILHFSLGFPEFLAARVRREWIMGKVEPIDGQTVLIIGLGKTGEAVAKRSRAMGLKTIGIRARPVETPNVDEVYPVEALLDLWRRADIIVTCVPLLDTTRGIVGPQAFASMKKNVVIIDVSRGGVIDENSLVDALDSDRIRGAALDVFAVEPLPPDHRLWGFNNVIITPHCSSVYEGWELNSVRMFSENLKRYLAGSTLSNIVNPARGY